MRRPMPSERDMWLMLLSMVRYALHRSSYIVGDACEMVLRFRGYLTSSQVAQIAREVSDTLEKAESVGATVGMKMDHETWTQFVQDLRCARKDGEP
jgi:hypothetical protein